VLEHGRAAGDHGLAVDQERRGLDAARSVNDACEAVGPIMTVAGEAADPRPIPAHHQPIAVVLDFVNPQWAGRWPGRLRRLARFNEAGVKDHACLWKRSSGDCQVGAGEGRITLS
jgi:hypothetical protein